MTYRKVRAKKPPLKVKGNLRRFPHPLFTAVLTTHVDPALLAGTEHAGPVSRPLRHGAAKVISASGKHVRHPHATTFLKRPAEMSQKCTARGEQNPMKTKQFRIGRLATLGQVI